MYSQFISNSPRLQENDNEWWMPIFLYFPQICFKERQKPILRQYDFMALFLWRKSNKIPCCRKLLFCAQALKSIIHPICCPELQGLIKMSQNTIVLFLSHYYTFEVPCECDRLAAICQGCLFNVDQRVWIRRKYSSTVWITYVQTRMGLRNSTGIKCFAQVTAKSFFKDTFHQHGEVRQV